MEFLLETNKAKDCPLSLLEMKKLGLLTLRKSRLPLKNKQISVSAAFVSPSVIRKINRQYRRKDQATDVLSFSEYPTTQKILKEKKTALFLGELIICCAFVKKSAKMNKLKFQEEFRSVFSHGLLHLLGFKHGKKMFAIQDEVVRGIK